MSAYHTFTTVRATEPDMVTLLANLRALDATAGVAHIYGTNTYNVKKTTAWTGPQITAAQNALEAAPAQTSLTNYTATSRQKDILAMIALVVRAKDTAAWNAMTIPQKVAATLAEADVWVNIRDFIETNM